VPRAANVAPSTTSSPSSRSSPHRGSSSSPPKRPDQAGHPRLDTRPDPDQGAFPHVSPQIRRLSRDSSAEPRAERGRHSGGRRAKRHRYGRLCRDRRRPRMRRRSGRSVPLWPWSMISRWAPRRPAKGVGAQWPEQPEPPEHDEKPRLRFSRISIARCAIWSVAPRLPGVLSSQPVHSATGAGAMDQSPLRTGPLAW
jgi:hypothetical protein